VSVLCRHCDQPIKHTPPPWGTDESNDFWTWTHVDTGMCSCAHNTHAEPKEKK
jgi:hypothetical protein